MAESQITIDANSPTTADVSTFTDGEGDHQQIVRPARSATAAATSLDNTDTSFGHDTTPASEELVASNTDRLAVTVQNTGDVTVYLGFGTAATTTAGLELGVGAVWSDTVYTGAINAIPASQSEGAEVRAFEFD